MEYWRIVKENKAEDRTINSAKTRVYSDLYHDNQKTLNDIQKSIPEENGISKQKTLREKVKFIFSGGGFTSLPYKDAVIDSFKLAINDNHNAIVTSISYPEDLELSKKFGKYITIFYVNYGLSFLFDELMPCSFPSDNKIGGYPS